MMDRTRKEAVLQETSETLKVLEKLQLDSLDFLSRLLGVINLIT